MNNKLHKVIEELQPFIKHNNNVYSPISDPVDYIEIILKNKLRIFMMDDKESNISSALMYVGVGSKDNPKDIPGLAHFLEHMLFMGSDTYPGSTYFQSQISKYGGFTNAFTADESTQYFFSTSDNFLGLLEIFSRFFVRPLFDVNWVNKEVNAVDSEHKKNIGSDAWRIMNVAKNFYIDNVNNQFSTGSLETLLRSTSINNDPDILRKRLIEFYDTHYSSDSMVLFLFHRINDDTINEITRMFELVPLITKNLFITKNIDAKIRTTNKIELITVKSVSEEHNISIKWLLNGSSRYVDNMSVDAYDIMSYILNNTGPDSLYAILSTTGYILDVLCGIDRSFDSSSLYDISIRLTPEGLSHWRDILYLTDAYINNLYDIFSKSTSLFDDFYNEIKNRVLLYLQTISNTSGLYLCQHYADVYERRKIDLMYLPISFALLSDKEIYRTHFLSCLQNMRLESAKVLVCSSLIDDEKFTKIDKYYGTHYNHVMLKISDQEKAKVKLYIDEKIIRIPQLNPYIKSVQKMYVIDPIIEGDDSYRRIKSSYNNLYYIKKGNIYKTYSVYGQIYVELEALLKSDPDAYILILMYFLCMYKINEVEEQQLNNAKLYVNISPTTDGILINIDGYNINLGIDNIFMNVMNKYFKNDSIQSSNQIKLIKPIKSNISTTPTTPIIPTNTLNKIDKEVYEMKYYDLMSSLQSYQYSAPYSMIASEFIIAVNKKHSISNEMMIASLKKISPEIMSSNDSPINFDNFNDIVHELISKGRVLGAFAGSIKVKQVMSIIKYMDNIIKPIKSKSLHYNLTNEELSSSSVKTNINPNNSERAVGYGLYLGNMREEGDEWKSKKPMCSLLESYIADRFSASIRTEKQIGYVALCNIINITKKNNPELYLLFVAQSTRDDVYDIVKDYVHNDMLEELKQLSNEEFEFMKQSAITKLLEKPKNIYEDCDRFLAALYSTYDIDMLFSTNDDSYLRKRSKRRQMMIDSLKKLHLDDLISFANSVCNDGVYASIQIIPLTLKM